MTNQKSQARSISEIIENSALGAAIKAFENYGYDSVEFKEARASYVVESAKNEAEYQAIKAKNRAWLYERGY